MSRSGEDDRWPTVEAARRPPASATAPASSREAAPRTREAIFDVDDISVYYGAKRAIRNVTLDLHKHEITALIGPSGCGKSTFIRCLNRMNDLIPSARVEGSIRYHGEDLYDEQDRPRAGAQADRDGVPEAQPVPQVDLREHRLRPAGDGR